MFKQLAISAVIATVALTASSARASFIGFLTGESSGTYNYTLRYTTETVTPPSFEGQEKLVTGDMITFYDVVPTADFVSAVVNGADSPNFTVTSQATGITPVPLVGAAGITDNSSLINVTFKYTGPTITNAVGVMKDFSATIKTASVYSGTHIGTGVGNSEEDYIGSNIPGENDQLYPVLLPTAGSGGPGTPEPATLGVLTVGALALLARRRRA